MDKTTIFNHLRQLDTAHRNDGDGGYEIVRMIRDLARSIDKESCDILWSALLELVAQRDEKLWGVALETLVQEHPDQVATKLSYLLNINDHSDEWKDQIVLALLRLAHQPAAPECVDYIRTALKKGRRAVLPLLAALCRVDIEICIELSSEYFSHTFKSDDLVEKNRGYIPAFVRYFLEVDAHLLHRLVVQTKALNSNSGRRLAMILDNCLDRPAFAREFGQIKITALRQEIIAGESS